MRRKAWLTIATRGDDAVSRASKRRPATIGRSIVAKYSGVTQVNVVLTSALPALTPCPQRPPVSGTCVVDAAFSIPGSRLISSSSSAANGLRRGSGTSSRIEAGEDDADARSGGCRRRRSSACRSCGRRAGRRRRGPARPRSGRRRAAAAARNARGRRWIRGRRSSWRRPAPRGWRGTPAACRTAAHVAVPAAAANAKTRQSVVSGSVIWRISLDSAATSARLSTVDTPTARTAPATASRALSVSSWPIRRPREAPIASRTANSRSRAAARARSRLARLAQAMSSTRPVIASSSHSDVS